ncbi:glutamine amidotransferase class-II [Naematelia encephala]|uniref:Glutamine amidotransferase class-II n=1 Tax=Naematelia encephala TaxID=71784 RepID=A0A1Y2AZ12_9TREE|nr:glutamine amidotransferase class-II [Naematelia encephala]
MCRWFAYLGDEPQLLEDVLLRPSHSLVKQIDEHFLPSGHLAFSPDTSKSAIAPSSANDTGSPNPQTNMDGFGVGWWSDAYETYENGTTGTAAFRPVVYKNTRPPLNDIVLHNLARGTEAKALVAHIRAGTGLTPVVETNCHPYTFGRHLFCHNGTLGSFHLFKATLLGSLPIRYQVAILGTTDSEHIAALYFYHLCGADGDWGNLYPVAEMAQAMRKTISRLEELKADAEKGSQIEHNALNLLVSSGASLVAIRYASPSGHEPPSLYLSTRAGATLNRKFKGHPDSGKPGAVLSEGDREQEEHGRHVIVASEPTTFDADEWELIKPGEVVSVREDMAMNRAGLCWQMTEE